MAEPHGLTPFQEMLAGIGAIAAFVATTVGAVFFGRRRGEEGVAGGAPAGCPLPSGPDLGPLYDRITTLEVEQRHMRADLKEMKVENRALRDMLTEMKEKLSEMHGMMSMRERDKGHE